MKLSRGQLSTPIEILRKTSTRSPSGAVKTAESVASQAWCELLPISTKDFVQAHAAGAEVNAKLHMDIYDDIQISDRIRTLDASDTTYDVIGIMPVPVDGKKIVLCKTI